MRKLSVTLLILGSGGLFFVCIGGIFVYNLAPVQERLVWRVESLGARIQRAINPPERVLFVPGNTSQPELVETINSVTQEIPPPVVTILPADTEPPTIESSPSVPTTTPTPAPTPTSMPGEMVLRGIVHEYQQFNNCGPANLAMALSFWGWQGDQRDTRSFLRPNLKVDDKNVMPDEMVAYVEGFTGLKAVTRVGGDLDLLRSLVAAGYPVLIEAGHHPPDDWWMGHYLVVSGYNDERQRFIVQDSLTEPDLPMTYDDLASHWWRDFDYVYVVIFPAEKQNEVADVLGPRWDINFSYQLAAQKAIDEIPNLQGRDQFFAWFNLGTSLVGLKDYGGAATAYDKAFEIYGTLTEEMRPYRLMWYQDGPYKAYYHTGRYEDVVNLANTTFSWVGQGVLEESYYWRGMAYLALGRQNNASSDFQKAAQLNPNYTPPRQELESLGMAVP
jgi:hypothetical protein